MVKLEIGKLYTCSEYHLLVFPTEERAAGIVNTGSSAAPWAAGAVGAASAAAGASAAWSKQLKCHVSWIPAGRVFCVVEEMGAGGGGPVHVIAGEAVGWIIVGEWTNIEEMKGQ